MKWFWILVSVLFMTCTLVVVSILLSQDHPEYVPLEDCRWAPTHNSNPELTRLGR